MPDPTRCPRCDAPLGADAPEGLCPACLLERGLTPVVPEETEVTAPRSPFLVVTMPRERPFRFVIEDPVTTLGRLSGNDLVIPDGTVSRKHAIIERRDGTDHLVNTSMGAPTLVNGKMVLESVPLDPGDLIQLGQTRIRYEAEDEPTITLDGRELREGVTSIPVAELATSPPSVSGPGISLLDALVAADREVILQRSPTEVFGRILDLAAKVLPFERAGLMMVEDGQIVSRMVRTLVPESGDLHLSRTIFESVLGGGQAVLIRDAQVEEPFRKVHSIVDAGVRSAMCVPLSIGEKILGLLYVDHRGEPERFDRDSLAALTHFANIAAIALESKRLVDVAVRVGALERELQKAGKIQRRMLPEKAPEIRGYEADAISEPCVEVGGDCFNYVRLRDGRLALAVGDVAGKGLPAALLMGLVQSGLELLAEGESDPEGVLTKLNRVLHRRIPANRFVALFLGVLDEDRHELTYFNAGQNVPLIVDVEGNLTELGTTGFLLGMFPEASHRARTVNLRPGDLLAIYSDGVVDAEDAAGKPFGFQRLQAVVKRACGGNAATMVTDVLEAVRDYQGDVPNADDLTLLALRRRS